MLTKTFAFEISFQKSLYIHALQSFIMPTQKQNALFIYLLILYNKAIMQDLRGHKVWDFHKAILQLIELSLKVVREVDKNSSYINNL